MSRMQCARLADGRLHLNDGPIDLVIACDGQPDDVDRAERAAARRFDSVLDELCAELKLLRRPTGERPCGPVALRMWRATKPFAAERFITPMAAVAGAVAEEILAAMLRAARLRRALVNNGGDIAFHLGVGEVYRIGMMDRPDEPSLFATTRIAFDDPIRGFATSGWRGRSFSLGIADAATVLAPTASLADAAATLIGNAVDLPGHPAIRRRAARDLRPDSDLGSRRVTTDVGHLNRHDIGIALEAGAAFAATLLSRGLICACALHLAGETRSVGAQTHAPRELAVHA